MRRVNHYTICKEFVEDMTAAGRFNPCLEITFRDRSGAYTHKLSAGYDDDLHVYRESGLIFVLSLNNRLGYVGLEVFSGANPAGEIFLQGDQVTETLGRNDVAPFTAIRRLIDLIG
jgi:hypothetical protein